MANNNGTLVAENVEVDMETLRLSQSYQVHPLSRRIAQANIAEAVIKALYPEDREKLEAYINPGER